MNLLRTIFHADAGTVNFWKISFHCAAIIKIIKGRSLKNFISSYKSSARTLPSGISDYILLSRTKSQIRVIICLCQGHGHELIKISIKSSVTLCDLVCIEVVWWLQSVYFPKTGYGSSEWKRYWELLLQYNVICKLAVNPVYI